MRVFTKAVSRWHEGLRRYVTDYRASEWYWYAGPVLELKGATSEQKNLEATQAEFYRTQINAYNTMFAGQQAILSALRSTLQPIIDKGVGQYGFTDAEDTALRTQASEGTADEYAKAKKAVAENMAAAGGGDVLLPSGAKTATLAKLATAGAKDAATKQLDITKAGYEQGRTNYLNAISAMSGVANMYNPVAYSNSAIQGGASAFQSATEIQKANAAASPWGAIGGVLGGVAGSFLGPIGSSLGSKIGGAIGGKK